MWNSYKLSKKRLLEYRLIHAEWELKSRLNPDNKYGYKKGIYYWKSQVEKTKKLLKQYK